MTRPKAHRSDLIVEPQASSEETERRLAELTEAVAARDNFIAVAAHELRNPMTSDYRQIELLLKGCEGWQVFAPDRLRRGWNGFTSSMGHYLKRAATLLDVSGSPAVNSG